MRFNSASVIGDKGYIGNAWYDDTDLLVVEADESDGSLVKYTPHISIFLTLSKDHKPVAETLPLFKTLAGQSEHVFCNADDEHLQSIPAKETFGLTDHADFFPGSFSSDNASASILKDAITYTVPFPGTYTIYNLLASLQVCTFLGCDQTTLAKAASAYNGIQRRFDRFETKRGITVIDDYAHNPEKISAALTTAQQIAPQVFALFQPHGFGPTKFLLQEFIDVFNKLLRPTDTLFLLPIYYAGGTVTKDIASRDIADGLTNCSATVITPDKRDDAISHITAHAGKDTLVISMGARDPSLPAFSQKIAAALDV